MQIHPSPEGSGAKPKVHGVGNARLDGVLEFVAFAAKPMPLLTLLDEGPRRIALIFEADVHSNSHMPTLPSQSMRL